MSAFNALLEPANPVAQSAGLAILGLIWLSLRRYRLTATFLIGSVLWIGLCATPLFADWLQHGLQEKYVIRPAASYPKVDAIVVLGGGPLPDIEEQADVDQASLQRTRVGFGLELYRAGRADTVLITGNVGEAEQMGAALAEGNVPRTSLIVDNNSRTTHENAIHSGILLRQAKLRRILLVTSSLHMARANASFQKQGLDVIPAPTIERKVKPSASPAWQLQRHALYRSQRYLREYIGRWAYELRGWA